MLCYCVDLKQVMLEVCEVVYLVVLLQEVLVLLLDHQLLQRLGRLG